MHFNLNFGDTFQMYIMKLATRCYADTLFAWIHFSLPRLIIVHPYDDQEKYMQPTSRGADAWSFFF